MYYMHISRCTLKHFTVQYIQIKSDMLKKYFLSQKRLNNNNKKTHDNEVFYRPILCKFTFATLIIKVHIKYLLIDQHLYSY